jgi:hypothetical protein
MNGLTLNKLRIFRPPPSMPQDRLRQAQGERKILNLTALGRVEGAFGNALDFVPSPSLSLERQGNFRGRTLARRKGGESFSPFPRHASWLGTLAFFFSE